MADKPDRRKKDKKKKESAETHVKRQQASHRRLRNKGRFGAGPHHNHLAGIFHGSIHKATYKNGHVDHSDEENAQTGGSVHPDQSQLFNVHEGQQGQYTDMSSDKPTPQAKKRGPRIQSEADRARGTRKQQSQDRAKARRQANQQGSSPKSSKPNVRQNYDVNSMTQEERDELQAYAQRMAGSGSPLAPLYDPDNFVEATDRERRRGASGSGSGAINADGAPAGFGQYGRNAAKGQQPMDADDAAAYIANADSDQEWDNQFVPMVDRSDPIESNDYASYQLEVYDRTRRGLLRSEHMSVKQAEDVAQQIAFEATKAQFGGAVNQGTMRDVVSPRPRRETREQMWQRVDQDEMWKTHRGTLLGAPAPSTDKPIELKKGEKREAADDTINRLSKSESQWLQQQLSDVASPFYGAKASSTASSGPKGTSRSWDAGNPDNAENLKDYLALRGKGYSSNEIMMWFDEGKPSGYTAPRGVKDRQISDGKREMAYQDMQSRKYGDSSGPMKDKYDMGAGSNRTFAYSMQAAGIDSLESLRKRFPEAAEADLVRYQHAQREAIDEHMLQANERWAHETRAARVQGKGKGANIEADDRVVVMTTNAGAPTVSVPANSLVGQYVIKKRKRMVVDEKMASRQQVKGEFPKAVRDQHIIEVSTGISLGIQGRGGLYHNTGWKVGSKRSKGYGKKAPVGASVLRDSTGAPIYDKDGNVRYTEGYTRPFTLGTDRDVGLRIFIG